MANDRTRTFEGIYTSNDNREHPLKVRIFKRLAVFGLAITLVRGGLVTTTVMDRNIESSSKDNKSDKEIDDDKSLIEHVIKENPYILKDLKEISYTVKAGDTLNTIALLNGTTVDSICEANNMSKDDVIYAGGTLKIEKRVDKGEEDGLIATLESYFYDYLFKSPIAKLASSNNPKYANQASYYRSIIFGSPKSEADIDPRSIYGEYVNAYISFHDREGEPTNEAKKVYIERLGTLAARADEDLNLANTTSAIVPFSTYRTYLQNGSTKDKDVTILS